MGAWVVNICPQQQNKLVKTDLIDMHEAHGVDHSSPHLLRLGWLSIQAHVLRFLFLGKNLPLQFFIKFIGIIGAAAAADGSRQAYSLSILPVRALLLPRLFFSEKIGFSLGLFPRFRRSLGRFFAVFRTPQHPVSVPPKTHGLLLHFVLQFKGRVQQPRVFVDQLQELFVVELSIVVLVERDHELLAEVDDVAVGDSVRICCLQHLHKRFHFLDVEIA